jgi:hypothetical protein
MPHVRCCCSRLISKWISHFEHLRSEHCLRPLFRHLSSAPCSHTLCIPCSAQVRFACATALRCHGTRSSTASSARRSCTAKLRRCAPAVTSPRACDRTDNACLSQGVRACVPAPVLPVALQPLQLHFKRTILAVDNADTVADDSITPYETASGGGTLGNLMMLEGSRCSCVSSSLPRRVRMNPGHDSRSVCHVPAGTRKGCWYLPRFTDGGRWSGSARRVARTCRRV